MYNFTAIFSVHRLFLVTCLIGHFSLMLLGPWPFRRSEVPVCRTAWTCIASRLASYDVCLFLIIVWIVSCLTALHRWQQCSSHSHCLVSCHRNCMLYLSVAASAELVFLLECLKRVLRLTVNITYSLYFSHCQVCGMPSVWAFDAKYLVYNHNR